MKKKIFVMSLPLLASMMISSCSGSHTHEFGAEWKYDENNHWHECTNNDGEKSGEAPHSWGEGTVTTPASCTENGVKTYTCECGATKIEAINKLGHNAGSDWQSDSTHHWHNCTNDGCYEELDRAEHSFVEDISKRVNADCTKKGSKTLICSVCNEEKIEEIPMEQHSWDNGVVTTQPSCEETGVKTFTCSVCNRTRTETVVATGHSWQSKNAGNAYQYNSSGSWDECSSCHAKRNEVVTETAPWAAFDFENENNIVCQHSDPTAYDKATHTLTTSNYRNYDGVKFTIADIVDETRLIIEVTLTVSGSTPWGPQGSFFFFDNDGGELGSVFCLGTNPFQDAEKHTTQYRTTAIENGKEVKCLSSSGAEFTYRFDFRQCNIAPRTFVINGANGRQDTPDIISVKSIVAKETICGHKAKEVKVGTDVASTCKVAGYTDYVCGHEGCGNVEYRIEKELAAHTPVEAKGAEQAYKFEFAGTIVSCSVCGTIIDDSTAVAAPWIDCGHADIEYCEANAGSNDHGEDTFVNNEEAATFYGTYNGGLLYRVNNGESTNRNIVEITMKGTGWKWNKYPAFQITIRDNTGTEMLNKSFHTASLSMLETILSIYKLDGSRVLSVSETNNTDYFVYRFDLRSIVPADKAIGSVLMVPYNNDAGNDKVSTSIKSIVFKSTLCGHSLNEYKETNIENAEKYQAAGTFVKCEKCGEISSSTITKQAPWLRLTPNANSNGYDIVEDGYSVAGKSKSLYFDIPTDRSGRTELAITVQTDQSSYEAFYLAANGDDDFGRSSYQFFTPNVGFNYNKAPFIKYVLKDGMRVPYDATACTITNAKTYFPTGTEKVTYIIDLTSANCDTITRIKLDGVAAGATTVFSVDLREPTVYPDYE